MTVLTDAQCKALRWLSRRSGTGVFNNDGVLLAQGDLAGAMRSTWNALRDSGLVTIEKKRVTLTRKGEAWYARFSNGPESDCVEDDE